MRVFDSLKKKMKMKRFKKWASVGEGLKVGVHSNCKADTQGCIKIGNHCEILGSLLSMENGVIEIGDYTEIRGNTFVGCVDSIKIGSYVMISNNIRIYDNNNHPTSPKIRKEMCKNGFYGDAWKWTHSEHKPVVIEDNVWIGERSTIMKGVTIGEGSIVGCNSVVTKDVPPYTIVAGNPAKVVKQIDHE